MQNIFIIGGCSTTEDHLSSCLKFDTKDVKWKEVAAMNEAKAFAACAVFKGRVVVSGGKHGLFREHILRTVVEYDHVSEKWSRLPNMIKRRFGHSSVAINNKLFVVGSFRGNQSETCEVFDSTCKKFVFLKQKPNLSTFKFVGCVETFSIGSKLIRPRNESATFICYDVENEEWSVEPFEVAFGTKGFSCTVVPKM